MEYLQQFLNPSILLPITILSISLPFLYFLCRPKHNHSKKTAQPPPPPEASGAWPIIGHGPLLLGPQPIYKVLGKMADKHGPIFILRSGVYRDVVVNNWETAKECLTTNDKVFANRPTSLAIELLSYDRAMFAFSLYGPYWRQARKIATSELLSSQRVEALRYVRESEVKTAIRELYDERHKELEMKKWFGDVTLNTMFRIVVGQRYMEATGSERGRKALRDLFEFIGGLFVSDAIPWLRWLDFFNVMGMKRTMKELDRFAQRFLDYHKMRKGTNKNSNDQDFMDVMLSLLHDNGDFGNSSYDSDTVIKAVSLGIIVAGSDTTKITMVWTLTLLLNNPDALKKAQQELDQHVGRDRQVDESDIPKLVYLKAVVKETLRLYPAIPLSIPHESTEDCVIAGYHIPARTRLLLNLPKIQRDPKVWSRPDDFVPERFLEGDGKGVDVRGKGIEVSMSFGSGRRVCPGASFANQMIHLSIASLLHGFDISTPSNKPVDMSESIGFNNHKTSPLHVILTPRLPAEAY